MTVIETIGEIACYALVLFGAIGTLVGAVLALVHVARMAVGLG